MFAPGARVGVAVSGGADSVCLLHVLYELRACWDLSLTVIHINHLLRGAASDTDESFVRELARTLELPLVRERIDVAAMAAVPGANLEQTARDVRRAVFRREMESGAVDRVALGHTRSDQAETVLFRFLRGAYTTGLSGMRPVTPEGIVRPLLEVDRAETAQYLRDRSLPWREDASNTELRFARNRIRHQLLPALASDWNPSLPRLLAQHATLAQEDEDYWNAEVDRVAPRLLSEENHAVILDVRQVSKLPSALQRRVLRRALEIVRGDLRQIDFSHIDRALRSITQSRGHFHCQAPGVDIVRSFDWVRFAKSGQGSGLNFNVALRVPGQVAIPGSNSDLTLELIDRQAGTAAETGLAHDILKADLDWKRIQPAAGRGDSSHSGTLILRSWGAGDAYRPVGEQHERKIKALFQQARVPLWERWCWPVVSAGRRIIWSRRFGAAAEFAACEATTVVLRISEKEQAS